MLRLVGRFLESKREGRRWPVVLIEAGWSQNGCNYTPKVLRESLPLFERLVANAFPTLDSDGNIVGEDHIGPDELVGLCVLNQIGLYENVRYSESLEAIVGDLVLLEGTPLADAYQHRFEVLEANGALDTIGLSIDADSIMSGNGNIVRIEQVTSCDVVTHPAAGGQIGHRIAASRRKTPRGSEGNKTMNPLVKAILKVHPKLKRFCEGIKDDALADGIATHLATRFKEDDHAAADAAAALGWDVAMIAEVDPDAVIAHLKKMIAMVEASKVPAETAPAEDPPADTAEEDAERVAASKKLVNTQEEATAILTNMKRDQGHRWLRDACSTRKLGDKSTDRLLAAHKNRVIESADAADTIAKAEQEYVDGIIDTATQRPTVRVREAGDKARDILRALFSPKFRYSEAGKQARDDMRDFHDSLHRIFKVYGNVDIMDWAGGLGAQRMKEAIDDTNFDAVYADSLNRALQDEYGGIEDYQVWQKLVKRRTVKDFRVYKTINAGYYGPLPTVAEGGTYNTLTTPTDRQETITLLKKGGTEHITMEALLNDDVGVYQAMISRIARAAVETRYDVVMDTFRIAGQINMSDSNKLTSAGRSPANLLTVALTGDATGVLTFNAAVKQMMESTGGSGKKKRARPKYIVLPDALVAEWTFIVQAVTGGIDKVDTKLLMSNLRTLIPELIIDPDADNDTDWFLFADPNGGFPVLEFATLGGAEEPRIYVADDQRFGNMFLKDQQDLVIKDFFACVAIDWVGIQGNDV